MSKLAPIILFVYNRPNHTSQTLNALALNPQAKESVLYIYCDGPKEDATNHTRQLIEEVRTIVKRENRFKEIIIVEHTTNKGLATSIVDGVTEVVNKYGKIIVLEDDIVTSAGFLHYMNSTLDVYEQEDKVMHISGYMYPHEKALPQTFFYNVPLCWGWATWKRAWKHFENDTASLIGFLDKEDKWKQADKFGENFLVNQLKLNFTGILNTWFIKWHISVFINNGFTLYPSTSLVNNIGFDNSGIHTGSSTKYAHKELCKDVQVAKIPIEENQEAGTIIREFYHNEMLPQNTKQLSMKAKVKKQIRNLIPFKSKLKWELSRSVIAQLSATDSDKQLLASYQTEVFLSKHCNILKPYNLSDVLIGSYTYIAPNSNISLTRIGKFCSIGPNLFCGYGIHPTDGLSTAPMFYSTMKQNGLTLSEIDKVVERKHIYIGNDVFIGMNVTILDGVTIGDGAVIGAGAVVSKDIPAYAIAVGSPIKIIRYRFNEKQIEALLKIKWWNFTEEKLKEVEEYFFDVDEFIKRNSGA